MHSGHHLVGNIIGCFCPNIHNLIIFLTPRDKPFGILPADLFNLLFRFFQNIPFGCRDDHVVNGNGDTAFSRIFITDILQPVGKDNRRFGAQVSIGVIHEFSKCLFILNIVYHRERNLGPFLYDLKNMIGLIGKNYIADLIFFKSENRISIFSSSIKYPFEFVVPQKPQHPVMIFTGSLGIFLHHIFKFCSLLDLFKHGAGFVFICKHNMAKHYNIALRYDLPQKNPADGRIVPLTVHANDYLSMQIGFAVIIGTTNLIGISKNLAFSHVAGNSPGHIINPKNDILTWHNNRTTVGR